MTENESHETTPRITRDMDRFVLVPRFSYAVTGAHVTEGSDNSESQDELYRKAKFFQEKCADLVHARENLKGYKNLNF